MNGLRCAAIDCKYNTDKYRCSAQNVVLSEFYVMTVHEGYQHFWRCKQYEQSERAKEIEEQMDERIRRLCEYLAKGLPDAEKAGEAPKETIRRLSDAEEL